MTVDINSKARAVADVTQGMIFASVEIAAPIERVFAALTVADELVRWWGSDDTYRTNKWEADLRPGGKWRAEGRSVDGKPFTVGGEFVAVDAPYTIVQTWQPDWDGGNVTTITYRLASIEGGTRLTMRHEGFGDRAQSCADHAQGWERVLGWLAGFSAPPVATQYFLCRLVAPRPSFAMDMNEREGAAMREHVAYWTALAKKRTAVLFGPVMDPAGPWGLGIVEVMTEADVHALQQGDPAIVAKIGLRYETMPMMRALLRPGQ